MNLQYLKYAIEVDKAGSISKAAESLYMNQPNLSKAIKELESMIGVSLFRRSTKGVSATTAEGRIFIEYAKSILGQFETMKSYFQAPKRNAFRVAIPRASYIAEAFTLFVDSLGATDEFTICFQETNSLQAIQSVTQDGYDLGVIRYRAQYERYFLSLLRERELAFREVLTSDSVVIMSARNPLSAKPVLKQADLNGLIEIVNDDFAVPRHISPDKPGVDDVPVGRKQIIVFERGSQFDLLSRISDTFMWVSPMPRDVLKRNGLVQKTCDLENIGFKDVLIHRRDHAFGPLEQSFLQHLEQVKLTVLPS